MESSTVTNVGPVCVCVRGTTTESFATLFWATLNLLYYENSAHF